MYFPLSTLLFNLLPFQSDNLSLPRFSVTLITLIFSMFTFNFLLHNVPSQIHPLIFATCLHSPPKEVSSAKGNCESSHFLSGLTSFNPRVLPNTLSFTFHNPIYKYVKTIMETSHIPVQVLFHWKSHPLPPT